jgi:putative AlgH/UPF0301 family transcriptional regulator
MFTHKFLIANPKNTDPVFLGKIVFIFKHNKNGAEGVIVNPKEIGKVGFAQLDDILEATSFTEIKEMVLGEKLQSVPLYSGGPCKTKGMYFLHGYEELLAEKTEFEIPDIFDQFIEKNSFTKKMTLIDGVYFGTPDIFNKIVESGLLKENKFRFFTGQSSWFSGQLESEVKNGFWTVMNSDGHAFFDEKLLEILIDSVSHKNAQIKLPLPEIPHGFNPSWN